MTYLSSSPVLGQFYEKVSKIIFSRNSKSVLRLFFLLALCVYCIFSNSLLALCTFVVKMDIKSYCF